MTTEHSVVPIPDDLNLAARHLLRAAMTICDQSDSDLNEFAKWLDVDSGMSEGILATVARAGLTAEANKERDARIKAQQELEQLRDDLTKRAAQEAKDAYQRGLADAGMSLKLIADIRFALGDDGKRMSDELVEYCRDLRRDEERYQALRAGCISPDDGMMPIEIAMRKMLICVMEQRGNDAYPTEAEFDAAIDAAMQTQAPHGA